MPKITREKEVTAVLLADGEWYDVEEFAPAERSLWGGDAYRYVELDPDGDGSDDYVEVHVRKSAVLALRYGVVERPLPTNKDLAAAVKKYRDARRAEDEAINGSGFNPNLARGGGYAAVDALPRYVQDVWMAAMEVTKLVEEQLKAKARR
jgi:hypothetical protein